MKKLLAIPLCLLLLFAGCSSDQSAYDDVVAENERLKQQINESSSGDVAGNSVDTPKEGVSSDTVSQDTVSQDTVSQGTVSQDTVSQGTVSQGTVSQGTVSQGTVSQGTVANPVKYEAHKTPTGELVVIVENTSGSTIADLEIEVVFLDAAGKMLSAEDDGHDAILPNEKVVSVFNDSYKNSEFDSYEITFKTEEDDDPYKNISKEFDVKSNIGNDGVVAKFTNNSAILCEELEVVSVYYFKGGVVGAVTKEKTDIKPGASVTFEFGAPTDSSFDRIQFDDYKIFINQAHNFD